MFMKTKSLISIYMLLLLSFVCVSAEEECDLKNFLPNLIEQVVFRNKCIDDLGCFYTGPPFYHPIFRPISLTPADPEKIDTHFWLYTPTQKDESYQLELTEESLAASTFDDDLPTKFLIHGFLSKLDSGDARLRMKDALLNEGDYNVIIVDWTGGNGPPYSQAVANTRVVGAQIAQLLNFLQMTRGIEPQSVHMIGHSLGAHIAGYAGKRLPNVGRISGIDPAGPFYTGTEKEVHLDPSDADFVDNMHTNMARLLIDGFGFPDPIGDLDFYPNGGKSQPLCELQVKEDLKEGDVGAFGAAVVSCDHTSGNEYYIDSIKNKNCKFIGTQCHNYDAYKDGSCDNNAMAVMGYPARKIPGMKSGEDKFYLDTNAEPPYCISAENS